MEGRDACEHVVAAHAPGLRRAASAVVDGTEHMLIAAACSAGWHRVLSLAPIRIYGV